MDQNQELTIDLPQLFNLSANLLIASFHRQTANEIEETYNHLSKGTRVAAGHIKAKDDENSVPVYLELDHSEYNGEFNLKNFLASVDILLQKFSSETKNNADHSNIPTLKNPSNGEIVFNIPAGIKLNDNLNVLMASVLPASDYLVVRLLFVNPEQFRS